MEEKEVKKGGERGTGNSAQLKTTKTNPRPNENATDILYDYRGSLNAKSAARVSAPKKHNDGKNNGETKRKYALAKAK